jgi:hypothetical protein
LVHTCSGENALAIIRPTLWIPYGSRLSIIYQSIYIYILQSCANAYNFPRIFSAPAICLSNYILPRLLEYQREMDAPRSHLVASVLLLLLIFTMYQYPRAVEARPLTLQQGKQKIYIYTKLIICCLVYLEL